MDETEEARKAEALADADYRADDLADKMFGFLAACPQRATREDVTVAMHEWLKSQLVILGCRRLPPGVRR